MLACVGKLVDEFRTLFHNGKVGREIGVKNVVKAGFSQSGNKAFDSCFVSVKAEGFAPCCTNCGCNLNNRDFVFIGKCIKYLVCIVSFVKSTDGAVSDTLSAK